MSKKIPAEAAFPYWCIGWREEHTGQRAAKTGPEPDRSKARRRSPYAEDELAERDQDRDGELEADGT